MLRESDPAPNPTPPPRKLNRRMREARLRKGWPQWKLAQRAHLSIGTVNKAERGDRDTSLLSQQRIAVALGVERLYLWPEEEGAA